MRHWLAAVIVGLLAAARPAGAAELIDFKVGLSGAVVTVMPLWMADAAGFFAAQGLKVQAVSMEGGARGIQILLSGDIQAMHAGLSPVVPANAQGADIRLVASASNSIPFTIFSAPTVKTGADLKGGIVGISSFASDSDVSVTLALQQLGLTRQDVTIVQLGGTAQRLAALLSGQVKAVPLIEPSVSAAREQGLTPLVDLVAAKAPWFFDGVAVTQSYLRDHRNTLTRFLKGYIEGAYLALGDEARAKDVIAKQFRTSDPKVIDGTYQEFRRIVPHDLEPTDASVSNLLAQLAAIGTEVPSRKREDYIDTSIIDELKAAGFLAALKAKYHVD